MPPTGTKRKVALSQVPGAAKRVILREAGDQRVRKVEEIADADGMTYEAEWIVGGMAVEVMVTSEGRLLCEKVEPAYVGQHACN